MDFAALHAYEQRHVKETAFTSNGYMRVQRRESERQQEQGHPSGVVHSVSCTCTRPYGFELLGSVLPIGQLIVLPRTRCKRTTASAARVRGAVVRTHAAVQPARRRRVRPRRAADAAVLARHGLGKAGAAAAQRGCAAAEYDDLDACLWDCTRAGASVKITHGTSSPIACLPLLCHLESGC